MRTPPHFVLVGAPKCGTTSLAAYLSQHPELFVVRGEPHFFGSDIAYNTPRMSAPRYRALFAGAVPGQKCGERSTWYLMSQKAAEEIHAHNPEARIIIQVREPAQLLYSLHGHHWMRGGREDTEDFAAALAAEGDRRAGRQRLPKHARFPESLWYSQVPRYAQQIPRYLECFGSDRVRVILLDDLQRDPLAVCAEVLAFLGVESDFQPDLTIENRAAPVGNAWLHRLWKMGSYRYTVRRLIPSKLYQGIRNRRRQRMEARGQGQQRAPLAPALRLQINRDFTTDIEYLQHLLGRDLSHWLR